MLVGESTNINKNINKIKTITNVFNKKYIIVYIVAFMTAMVGLGGEMSPFSISFIVACFANSIPAIGIIIVSVLGNAIKFGIDGALSYLFTVAVMVVTFFIIKPKYNDNDRNEYIKMGKNIVVSTLIIQLVKCMIVGFTIYDILTSITFTIIAYIFYKIFVNSVPVLENYGRKSAFTIEEVIGTSLLITIAISCLGNYQILGVSIRNVLSILVVLILGWKNGVLVGATAGVTIGVTLGVITGTEPIMIAAYAVSGMISGILNKFGRIGVIIGFALGNIVLAYVSNGYAVELIHFKEILIASIGLLAIPKNISIDIEEFIPNRKFFPVNPGGSLNKSKQVVEEFENVSEALHDMAQSYKEDIKGRENDINKESNKEIFITELLNNLEPYKENILYEDIADVKGNIIDKIFSYLLDKQEIDKHSLVEIFKQCNSYIIGIDDNEINKSLNEAISQIVRTINTSYKISKANFIWQRKIEQVEKNAKKQLNTVSKAINGMAQNIKSNIENEKKFEKQKQQIIKELKNNEIQIEDIGIRRQNRFFIEIYLTQNEEDKTISKIEKILSGALGEKIVIAEDTVGTHLRFLSKDNFKFTIANSEATKSQSEESGDSMISVKLKDGNYLVALSDGMGTGREAKKSSSKALKMLERLLLSGFDNNTSIELINSSLIANNQEIFATLDIAIIDLYKGKIEFIKSGACPSYIKNRKKVQIIKANSLPAGIIEDSNLTIYDCDIKNNDILLMCTDGILDSNIEYKNKELWVKYLLEDIETESTRKIADLTLTEAIDNNFGRIQDDLSVIVCKFKEIK